jgi:apolipoprotein N-acyltransferase
MTILVVPPAASALAAALLVISRATLVLLALYHVPLLAPALYHALEYQPLTPMWLLRLLAAFFLLPEAGAWLVRRLCRASARIEGGALVIERRERRSEVPVSEIDDATIGWLPLPWPALRLRSRAGEPLAPPVAAADPATLLAALVEAGAREPVRGALGHPAVRHASARACARGWLDHPLLKFAVFPLVPAVPLFRLHQWLSYGGTFGEYHAFGLKAYLLGFGLTWLLSAAYLLLFASALRALGEVVALLGIWLLPEWDLGVRRVVEALNRTLYYLTPPILLVVRLVLQ